MNKQRDYLYCSEVLSLLTLRIVLTDARQNVPPHVSVNDMNEELAAKAIEKLKRQYKRYVRSIRLIENPARIDW